MDSLVTNSGYCHPHECWMFLSLLFAFQVYIFVYCTRLKGSWEMYLVTRVGQEQNARRHLTPPTGRFLAWRLRRGTFALGDMSCRVMIGSDERHTFLLWVVLLFPWLRHISILNHNCGKAHTHLTPTYVNSISPKTARYERMQPSILWKWLAWNVCSPMFSHLSHPSDTLDKAEREICPSKMEPFSKEVEFWSKLMVSGKKYLISRTSCWAFSSWLFIKWRWKGNL